MEYNAVKKEIKLGRKLSKLDKFAVDFTKILQKHVDYVVISGYVSIILGRSRATEDIDIFIKNISQETFSKLYDELLSKGFECINTEEKNEAFSYLKDNLAIRFSEKNKPIPNFEVKFAKKEQEDVFDDFIIIKLKEGTLNISSLERQIAFKKYYLQSEKDIEDALHIEELFKEKLDYNKINKLKLVIEKIKENESKKI
jgi:hypothetical protein